LALYSWGKKISLFLVSKTLGYDGVGGAAGTQASYPEVLERKRESFPEYKAKEMELVNAPSAGQPKGVIIDLGKIEAHLRSGNRSMANLISR